MTSPIADPHFCPPKSLRTYQQQQQQSNNHVTGGGMKFGMNSRGGSAATSKAASQRINNFLSNVVSGSGSGESNAGCVVVGLRRGNSIDKGSPVFLNNPSAIKETDIDGGGGGGGGEVEPPIVQQLSSSPRNNLLSARRNSYHETAAVGHCDPFVQNLSSPSPTFNNNNGAAIHFRSQNNQNNHNHYSSEEQHHHGRPLNSHNQMGQQQRPMSAVFFDHHQNRSAAAAVVGNNGGMVQQCFGGGPTNRQIDHHKLTNLGNHQQHQNHHRDSFQGSICSSVDSRQSSTTNSSSSASSSLSKKSSTLSSSSSLSLLSKQETDADSSSYNYRRSSSKILSDDIPTIEASKFGCCRELDSGEDGGRGIGMKNDSEDSSPINSSQTQRNNSSTAAIDTGDTESSAATFPKMSSGWFGSKDKGLVLYHENGNNDNNHQSAAAIRNIPPSGTTRSTISQISAAAAMKPPIYRRPPQQKSEQITNNNSKSVSDTAHKLSNINYTSDTIRRTAARNRESCRSYFKQLHAHQHAIKKQANHHHSKQERPALLASPLAKSSSNLNGLDTHRSSTMGRSSESSGSSSGSASSSGIGTLRSSNSVSDLLHRSISMENFCHDKGPKPGAGAISQQQLTQWNRPKQRRNIPSVSEEDLTDPITPDMSLEDNEGVITNDGTLNSQHNKVEPVSSFLSHQMMKFADHQMQSLPDLHQAMDNEQEENHPIYHKLSTGVPKLFDSNMLQKLQNHTRMMGPAVQQMSMTAESKGGGSATTTAAAASLRSPPPLPRKPPPPLLANSTFYSNQYASSPCLVEEQLREAFGTTTTTTTTKTGYNNKNQSSEDNDRTKQVVGSKWDPSYSIGGSPSSPLFSSSPSPTASNKMSQSNNYINISFPPPPPSSSSINPRTHNIVHQSSINLVPHHPHYQPHQHQFQANKWSRDINHDQHQNHQYPLTSNSISSSALIRHSNGKPTVQVHPLQSRAMMNNDSEGSGGGGSSSVSSTSSSTSVSPPSSPPDRKNSLILKIGGKEDDTIKNHHPHLHTHLQQTKIGNTKNSNNNNGLVPSKYRPPVPHKPTYLSPRRHPSVSSSMHNINQYQQHPHQQQPEPEHRHSYLQQQHDNTPPTSPNFINQQNVNVIVSTTKVNISNARNPELHSVEDRCNRLSAFISRNDSGLRGILGQTGQSGNEPKKYQKKTVNLPIGKSNESSFGGLGGFTSSPNAAYFNTSSSKAKFLVGIYSSMTSLVDPTESPPFDPPHVDQNELTRKKQELVNSLTQKLSILGKESEQIHKEMEQNDRLTESVTEAAMEAGSTAQVEKLRLLQSDNGRLTKLSLNLTGQMARVDNAILRLTNSTPTMEKKLLTERRERLSSQLKDANDLRQGLNSRKKVVYEIIESLLGREKADDFGYSIETQATLLEDSREIEEKLKLGHEQIQALQSSLPSAKTTSDHQ